MKTQSFLQILFIFFGIFLFHLDALTQNDTTDDPWQIDAPWIPGRAVYIERDTAITGGHQGVSIGSVGSRTDLFIETSSPEHGLMIHGRHTGGSSGRLGFGMCDYFDTFMTLEPHSSGHCKGNLAFWTDDALNSNPFNPTIKMILSNEGALGIGVPVEDIPSNVLLAVGGKTMFEDCEIALRQDWPDYVFDNAYQLPSLEERAAFYTTYKRLPTFPTFQSAAAMNGILNVQNIVVQQQETIEQNAIYITQLNEQNKELKAQNEVMQKELEEIKQMVQALSKK